MLQAAGQSFPDSTLQKFPSSIGEYGMGKLLGRGAFGSVYEVTRIGRATEKDNTTPTEKYAIKIIEKASIKNEAMAKRVRNEVALHRRLSHPNVLALHHFFEDDSRVYLLMELCSRGEVYSLLRRRREAGEAAVLSEGEARAIFRDVVAGLRFLHSSGIIHRDLKLSNILLSENGQAKIADFGLAVAVDSTSSQSSLPSTMTHDSLERTICGTPNYLAPEIVSKRRYGRSADIWSLGCLLYSFLVGRPPFDSPDLPSTFERVKNHDYRIPDFISPSARDLIARLLNPSPEARPNFDQIIFHPFFNPAVSQPLQTRRLAPLKQATKYGTVEIKADGTVVVDFLEAPDVIQISSDGLFISVHSRSQMASVSASHHSSGSHQHSSPTASVTFSIARLPEQYKKRYEYARRFVNLVRSKTPLIVLSTCRFKAYLMENSSSASASVSSQRDSLLTGDFYLHYRDGHLKLDYCWVSRQLRFIDPHAGAVRCCLSDPSLQVASTLNDPQLREALLEFLARYRQCQQVRDAILHPDGQERGALKRGQFPFVIREDVSYEEKENRETFINSSNSSNRSRFSNDSSLHHPSVTSLQNPFIQKSMQSFANASLQSISSPLTSLGANHKRSQPQPSSLATIHEASSMATAPAPAPVSLLSALQRKHLPGVGWCLSVPNDDGHFLVLFDDGVAVEVCGADDCVVDGRTGERLRIDSALSEEMKQRLAAFSHFL